MTAFWLFLIFAGVMMMTTAFVFRRELLGLDRNR